MLGPIQRNYEINMHQDFQQLLKGNMLPDSISDIGRIISSSLKYKSFSINFSDDIRYIVQYKPTDNIQTINPNEPVDEECEAYIYNEESTWHLEHEQLSESEFFPTLKQSFNEGDSFRNREADYKYYFDDGEVVIAVSSANPVERLESNLMFTDIEFMGGEFPKKWLLSTDDNEYYYLRERSGSIKLISESGNGDLVFTAYVGGEHPGTSLKKHEVLELISSVDYINIKNNYNNTVSQEAHEEHFKELKNEKRINVIEPDNSENIIDNAIEEASGTDEKNE